MRQVIIFLFAAITLVSCEDIEENNYQNDTGVNKKGVFCSSDSHCLPGYSCLHCSYTVAGETCGCKGSLCGKCMPIAGCIKDEDCGIGGFCHLPAGCKSSPAKLGKCKPKPVLCNLMYSPVCGCDGKFYGNTCASHLLGVTVDFIGFCKYKSMQCKDVNNALDKIINNAKKCDKQNECSYKTNRGRLCICQTYVVKERLDFKEKEDLSIQLGILNCPACSSCKTPISGKCNAQGYCEDMF